MQIAAQLLDKTIAIQAQHQSRVSEERGHFNIFSMLRQDTDEVHLHSRFIYELLNPQGSHEMGSVFLEAFLASFGSEFLIDDCVVQREYKNIDILLTNGRQALVLENKIHAADQPKQLVRYYKDMRREGYEDVQIVYLTLYGDPPGAESAGNLDESIITTLSYKSDIIAWLDSCVEIAQPYPPVREVIVQYRRLVEALTGQASGRQIMDIQALINDQDHLKAAIAVKQALQQTQIEVQYQFWMALEERLIAEGYDITEYWKYDKRTVDGYYRKGSRRYGLLFSLPDVMDQELVAFFVGVQDVLFYGFVPMERGTPVGVSRSSGFEVLAELLRDADDGWHSSPSLIGWRAFSPLLDFQQFSTPATLVLIEAEARAVTIESCVEQINAAIESFYTLIDDDPRFSEQEDW